MIDEPEVGGAPVDRRTGLRPTALAVLRAVDRACTWRSRRLKTAPTTRAVEQLGSSGLTEDEARALLCALGQPWRTLHPLLVHGGNWGSAEGDEPADDEFTRVGLSPLGRLALDAADSRCAPVPLGLVLGDVHPRRSHGTPAAATPTTGVLRPGFGLGPVLDALDAVRSGVPGPSRVLPVPPSPARAVVDVDLSAMLAGEPTRARLGCRFDVVPAPAVPPPPPGPPPEVVAAVRARGLSSFGWVTYGNRQHAGPSLLITGAPTGVDIGLLEDQLREAAQTGHPPVPVADVVNESTDRVGVRVLVHTDHPTADVDALRAWTSTLPAATDEVTWHLPGGADAELRRWRDPTADDDGLRRLASLRA
ncbi:hypothetical protein ACUN7V_20080 [Quadrisphaera oryzae]|uniref:hypothetical protein n=1 Tax=Quadrisphaera TaxID=317661 RepID=UPI0016483C44|nr:hypothetical protein [Quadrisphaera sp. RL12-1S]MBC3761273.1 hypothetical protein [Quadrisphaera sp. RL12-1S]